MPDFAKVIGGRRTPPLFFMRFSKKSETGIIWGQ
jgi:hypothetical protein